MKSEQKISNSSWVTVRAWRALLNHVPTDPKLAALKGGTVGHASLQTPQEYLSHWPGEELTGPKQKVVSASNSLLEDECAEGYEGPGSCSRTALASAPELKSGEEIMEQVYNRRTGEPELVICKSPLRKAEFRETLYSLDNDKVKEEINRIQKERDDYMLKVKAKNVTKTTPKPLNCAAAVYRALSKGGINQLSSVCASLQTSFFAIKPQDVEKCVRHAKLEEEKRFPQTKSFSPPSDKEELDPALRFTR